MVDTVRETFGGLLGRQWDTLKTGLRRLVAVVYRDLGSFDFMRTMPLLQTLNVQPVPLPLHAFPSESVRRSIVRSYKT